MRGTERGRALEPFDINPDIRRAATPPSSFYRTLEAFERCRENIFARSWQYVGDTSRLSQAGWGEPVTLLPTTLDEPLLLQSDEDGRIHCLSNVCTHRANLVVTEAGERRALRCGYHGRKFELDGTFASMPCFEEVKNFPADTDSLPELLLGQFGPLLFTSIQPPEVGFDDWLAPVARRISGLPLDALVLDPSGTREFDVASSWALYVENYLEGFHIPFVHAGLNAAIEWESYETECLPWGVLQTAEAKPDEVAFARGPGQTDAGKRIAAYYYWLFPNLMLNFYPWGLSLNVVEPRGHQNCTVRYRVYVWDESLREQGAGSGLDSVEMEDETIVEQVQRGMQSRLYSRGRLSPSQEAGCHRFHQLLAAALHPEEQDGDEFE